MPLNATAIKSFKHSGKPTGDKHSDGEGMYLLVKAAGMYWRMDYSLHGKRKTLALGVYPAVSLLDARKRRVAARELIAAGIDPSEAKQEAAKAQKLAAANTYESVAREFHRVKADGWSEAHATKWLRMNEIYLFPQIGHLPIRSVDGGRRV